jgi:hypothetical protein
MKDYEKTFKQRVATHGRENAVANTHTFFFNTFNQFRKIYQCHDLVPNSSSYDVIIRMRTDMFYSPEHCEKLLLKILHVARQPAAATAPSSLLRQHVYMYSDWVVWGKPDVMNRFACFFKHLWDMPPSDPHSMLSRFFQWNNIQVHTCFVPSFLNAPILILDDESDVIQPDNSEMNREYLTNNLTKILSDRVKLEKPNPAYLLRINHVKQEEPTTLSKTVSSAVPQNTVIKRTALVLTGHLRQFDKTWFGSFFFRVISCWLGRNFCCHWFQKCNMLTFLFIHGISLDGGLLSITTRREKRDSIRWIRPRSLESMLNRF